MLAALSAIKEALQNVRLQGYTYIWANLAFVTLSLPLVTAPAALSALYRVGHAVHSEPHEADLDLFWQTFRANLWRALPWGLAHAVFAVVNFSNMLSYREADGIVFQLLQVFWAGAGFVWLALLLYTWPIYYEMEKPALLGATRNALVMILRNPFFTLMIVLGVLIIAVISTVLAAAWVLLTWGVISAVANAAVMNRLQHFRQEHSGA